MQAVRPKNGVLYVLDPQALSEAPGPALQVLEAILGPARALSWSAYALCPAPEWDVYVVIHARVRAVARQLVPLLCLVQQGDCEVFNEGVLLLRSSIAACP